MSHGVLIGLLFYDYLGESVSDRPVLGLIRDEESGEFLIYVLQVEQTGLFIVGVVLDVHESFYTLHTGGRQTVIFGLEC